MKLKPPRHIALGAVLLLILATVSAAQSLKVIDYRITGRIVDEHGNAVHGATIYFEPEGGGGGCVITTYSTDKEGRFLITERMSNEERDWYLRAVDYKGTSAAAVSLVSGRQFALGSDDYPEMKPQRVHLGAESTSVDLGDLRPQTTYNTIFIHLQDQAGKPVLAKGDQVWFSFKLRDSLGDVIEDMSTSELIDDASAASLGITLPTGKWSLELWAKGLSGTKDLNVPASRERTEETITLDKPQDGFRVEKSRQRLDSGAALTELQRLKIPYDEERFLERIQKGNLRAVRLFLDAGINPDCRDAKGKTALMVAVENGKTEVAYALLRAGADTKAKDPTGETALMHLSFYENAELAQALIDSGADVNTANAIGFTPLMRLVRGDNTDVVDLLLRAGAKVNARTTAGATPLMAACSEGATDSVQHLLQWGARINARDRAGNTPLLLAVATRKEELVQTLLAHGANPNSANKSGLTPLTQAALTSGAAMFDLLRNAGGVVDKNSRLIQAVVDNDVASLRLALKQGANPNLQGVQGDTPLLRAVDDGNFELVRLLVVGGADLEARDWDGCTALMLAALRGHLDMVRFLVAKGANVNARAADGENALRNVLYADDGLATAKALIELGIDVNNVGARKSSALRAAILAENVEMIDLLRKAGAKEPKP